MKIKLTVMKSYEQRKYLDNYIHYNSHICHTLYFKQEVTHFLISTLKSGK